jgi:Dolichyl-phosphate-mannose-protein mannosyltransferase
MSGAFPFPFKNAAALEHFPVRPVSVTMTELQPATASSTTPARRLLFSAAAIVVCLAAVRLVLYLFAAPNYGYFRDELYYLACGQHPAWGYVDQPPLIAWIAWLLEHTIGTSLWALHLLPALAGAATIVLAGILARELGGRRWAIFLAALAALMAPILLIFTHLFTMNAFDPMFWTAIAILLVRIAKSGNERLWIPTGILAGITILNKYGIVFWLAGLFIGLLLSPMRSSLRKPWIWISCALGALIALPNFLWQWSHQFPFLQLMHNIRQEGRDISLPPLPFLKAQAQMLGYAPAILVLFALLFFFSKQGRSYRALGWAYLIFLGVMMALHGKMYYLTAVYPMLFAAGAVWIEGATQRRIWLWAKPALAVVIAGLSAVYLPMALPVLSVPRFLAYEHTMGLTPQRFEHNQPTVLPQIYADMFGWPQMVEQVAAFYHTLSPGVQRQTAIFGNNYGEAAAVDFFGPQYGLPKAIGGHQSYWIWGPRNYTGASMIILGEGDPANMQKYCTTYKVIGNAAYPLSRLNEWKPIYYCQGLKWNLQQIWPRLKHWD